MKLSAEQIDRLYQFTRQHYVEWFDLQTELVDHLANAIEKQCHENPKLSFDEALQMEFKKFGVFGFLEVVEKRQVALNKKYNKLVLNELKTFFSIPKIIGTFSAIGVVFYLSNYIQQGVFIFQFLFLVLCVLFFVGLTILANRNKKNSKITGKKWLLKEIIFGYSSLTGLIYIPIQFAIRMDGENFNSWYLSVFSFLLVVLVLLEYIVLILIPYRADDFLKETYPEYEFVK
jgi:hypothetical protein